MSMMPLAARYALTAAVLAAGFAAPAVGGAAALGMLNQLDPGAWEIRERGPEAARHPQSMCIDTGRRLVQLRHPGVACSSIVLDDRPNEVTVQYTCRGQGYGRTHIRRENNGLVQIDSQGIANGLPFSFAAEARRMSACRS